MLYDYLGIRPETSLVISAGDSDSDIPMFRKSRGISVGQNRLEQAYYHVKSRSELLLALINL